MSAVVLRALAHSDLPAVHALYEATFGVRGARAWQRRYRWQFFDTPGAAVRPSKFFVATVSGELRGFVAAFPVRLKLGTESRVVLSPCDLMVAPAAAGFNLGWRLLRACARECGGHLTALSYSEATGKIFDALRAAAVPLAPLALRPIALGTLALRALRQTRAAELLDAPSLAWVANHVASGANAVGAAISHATLPRMPAGYTVARASVVDEAYDDLWQRVSPSMPVVTVRDRSFVKWRFLDDPSFAHTLLEARDRSGELCGYAGSCVVTRGGLRYGKVMDLFCHPTSTDAADALLRGTLLALRGAGADLAVVKGLHPLLRRRARRFFYLAPRTPPPPARVLVLSREPAAAMVLDAENWHVAHADGDDDFSV